MSVKISINDSSTKKKKMKAKRLANIKRASNLKQKVIDVLDKAKTIMGVSIDKNGHILTYKNHLMSALNLNEENVLRNLAFAKNFASLAVDERTYNHKYLPQENYSEKKDTNSKAKKPNNAYAYIEALKAMKGNNDKVTQHAALKAYEQMMNNEPKKAFGKKRRPTKRRRAGKSPHTQKYKK